MNMNDMGLLSTMLTFTLGPRCSNSLAVLQLWYQQALPCHGPQQAHMAPETVKKQAAVGDYKVRSCTANLVICSIDIGMVFQ